MTSYSKVAVVTGSNKGVGFACVRQLALQYPQSTNNGGPFLIYLTARDEARGRAALHSILEDPKLKDAKALTKDGGLTEIRYLALDIESADSVSSFVATINKEHPDGIDILINNAATAIWEFDQNAVDRTLNCNYYGVLNTVQLLMPRIRESGRIVNVASQAGYLDAEHYDPDIKRRFREAETPEDITQLMEEYRAAVANGSWSSHWHDKPYHVSKAGLIGLTRALAAQNAAKGSKTLINSCCPGITATDMSRGMGHTDRTPDDGAQTLVFLALGDIGEESGKFWVSEKVCEW